jgi:hypothetical protein
MVTEVGAKNLSPIDTLCVVGGVVVGGVVVGGALVGGVADVDDVVVTPVVSVVEDSVLVSESPLVVVGVPDAEVEPVVRGVAGTVEWTLVPCATSPEAQAKRVNAKTLSSPRCFQIRFLFLTPKIIGA